MSEPQGIPVTFGSREYRVVPQGIGRIRRKLVKLMALAEGVVDVTGEIDAELHTLLKTFVPDISPLHELFGYDSEESYEAGGEPEGAIREPTVPEVFDLIQTIYTVNGADRLVRLGKDLVGADAIRHRLRKAVISWEPSASSPSPNGGSDLTSSTPSEPIPPAPESEESPSLASSIST